LARTGEKVSLIGLGGYHVGSQSDPEESVRIIRTGIDEGINFLDNCWDSTCPEDDYGISPNALEGKGLDAIFVFFDLKSDWPKRGCRRTAGVRMVNELRTNGLRPTPGPPTLI
jgi:hypothetical protein